MAFRHTHTNKQVSLRKVVSALTHGVTEKGQSFRKLCFSVSWGNEAFESSCWFSDGSGR